MATAAHEHGDPFDDAQARQQWNEEAKKLGRFNLAIFGKTGVGKSTLINAIFGEDVAPAGSGKPVTQESHLYVTRSGALGLYDTRGLEVGVSSEQVLSEVRSLVEGTRGADPSGHIHVAYYCIRAGDHRIEPAEKDFIRGLHELGLPVFLVVTQVHKRGEVYRSEHLEFAQHLNDLGLPIYLSRPFLTAALPDPQLGYEAHGLKPLLDVTYEAAPEAAKSAFAAAQIVDRGLKYKAAKARIAIASTLAAGVGATPIPFADAALLVPIQTGMMASISQIYRLPMDAALALSLAATAVATNSGRALVTGTLKLLPGAGSVVGGAVAAAVASSFTIAIGQAWIRVCELMLDGKFGPMERLDNGKIQSVFLEEFKRLFTTSLTSVKRDRNG
jgi:uncharacterized protein (DUF697 family)/predicted GTPase